MKNKEVGVAFATHSNGGEYQDSSEYSATSTKKHIAQKTWCLSST